MVNASAKKLENSTGSEELMEVAEQKFFFKVKDSVLATHRDLQTLRYCSNLLKLKPNRKIIIVGPSLTKHTEFMVNTLHHLGVSCGQIVNSSSAHPAVPTSDGIWVLVRD